MAKPSPDGMKFKPTGVTGKKTTSPAITKAAQKKRQTDLLKKKAESLKPLAKKKSMKMETLYKSPAMKKSMERTKKMYS